MNTLLESGAGFVSWVWGNSWQAALLVGIVLAVQRICGRRLAPVWRHGLWWLVVGRLVLPWMPESGWSLYNWFPRSPALGAHLQSGTPVPGLWEEPPPPRREVGAGAPDGSPVVPPAASVAGRAGRVPAITAGVVTAPASARSEAPGAPGVVSAKPRDADRGPARGFGWWPSVTWVWAGGALAMLLRLAGQHAAFARRVRRMGRPIRANLLELVDECRRAMGVTRRLEVREGAMVSSPAVYGWRRPTLLLPERMGTELGREALRHVFLHELGHVRRRDPAVNALLSVLQALHWFNPLVWFAFHRMRADRELATDALVLSVAGEGEARTYGRTIVRVLEGWRPSAARPALVGILEDAGQLRDRIRAIAGFRRPSRRAAWGGVLLVGLATVALTNGVTGPGGNAEADADVVWRQEFVGWTALSRRADLPDLRSVLALEESQALLRRLDSRLAAIVAGWIGLPPATEGGMADSRARLVRTWLEAEHVVEVRANAEGVVRWAAAARLESAAAEAWLTAARELWRRAGQGGGGDASGPRSEYVDGWLIVGVGQGGYEALRQRVRGLGARGLVEEGRVGRFRADLGRLAAWLNWGKEAPGPIREWPRAEWTLESRKGRLRTEARLSFTRALDWTTEPWQVPTHLVRDPLVGFTAVQGLDRWLGRADDPASAGTTAWAKQGYFWSLADKPWLQYAALAQEVPEDLLKRFAERAVAWTTREFGWNPGALQAVRSPEGGRVDYLGWPYLQPYAMRVEDRGRTWLHGGAFPLPGKGPSAPAPLVAQVEGRADLLFYDWETTGRRWVTTNRTEGFGVVLATNDVGRLRQFRELAQFAALMRDRNGARLPTRAGGEVWVPGAAWIDAALPWLGEAVTEIRLTGPREVGLVRSSGVGLTSMELLWVLARLDDAPPSAPGARGPRPGAVERAAGGEAVEKPLPPGILRIRARAVDAETGAPVKRFRLLSATSGVQGEPPSKLLWEPVAEGQATEGEVEVPVHWTWPGMRFGATAPGYTLSVGPVFEVAGQQEFEFRMKCGSGPEGQVWSAEGRPLAGVTVGLLGYGITMLSGGQLGSSSFDGRGVTTTDAGGRFAFPSLVPEPRVVAAHPEFGYAEVAGSELARDPVLHLRAWGSKMTGGCGADEICDRSLLS